MEQEEAYKIFGVNPDFTSDKIKKIYLGKSEFYQKQLEDLKYFPHLVKEKEKFNSEYDLLKKAFVALGGVINNGSVIPRKTLKEQLIELIVQINNGVDNLRDHLLNSLKKIPGIIFFTLLLITFIILFKIIF